MTALLPLPRPTLPAPSFLEIQELAEKAAGLVDGAPVEEQETLTGAWLEGVAAALAWTLGRGPAPELPSCSGCGETGGPPERHRRCHLIDTDEGTRP